jgi:Tetratricopeptide repeat
MTLEPTKSTEELLQEAHELVAAGKLKEAETFLLELVKQGDPSTHTAFIEALSAFAEARGDIDESIRFALRMLATTKLLHGEDSNQAVSTMVRLAKLYELAGRYEEANDLFARAQYFSERLVYGQATDQESEVGSSETLPKFKSTMKFIADESSDHENVSKAKSSGGEDKHTDGLDFVFADDEPRPEKSGGWIMDAVQKSANRKQDPVPEPGPAPARAKREITGAHQFLPDTPQVAPTSSFMAKNSDLNEQTSSRTNASASRKQMAAADSGLKAFTQGKDEIARSLDLTSMKWSIKQFLEKKNNLISIGIGCFAFFVLLLVTAYLQPRQVTPLDAYVSMPHSFRSMSGHTKIKLVHQEAMQLEQGDSTMIVSTSYVVDWRSRLEVVLRSFFEKQFWLQKSTNSIIADNGSIFYTPNNVELLMGDEMLSLINDADDYYLQNSRYPPESDFHTYRNIFTHAAAKPILKRLEFLGADASDVAKQIETWKENLCKAEDDPKAGVINCFELLASYPTGRVNLCAVRSCKPKQNPQVIFSSNGEVSDTETASFISPDGLQIRWKRVWIQIDEISPEDACILHHASLVFFILLSIAIAVSYRFISLQGDERTIRFRLIFVSLLMVAFYAASPYLP